MIEEQKSYNCNFGFHTELKPLDPFYRESANDNGLNLEISVFGIKNRYTREDVPVRTI